MKSRNVSNHNNGLGGELVMTTVLSRRLFGPASVFISVFSIASG